MRRVARRAAFGFYRRMFKGERSLLVGVTLNAGRVPTSCQSGLLELKTAMRIMTITAAHGAFQNLMMEGRRKRRLDLAMATNAKLRVIHLQQFDGGEAGLFGIGGGHSAVRAGKISIGRDQVRRMTVSAADVVAPVLAATEVIVLFLARMTGQTSLGVCLGRFVLEGNDLGRIALCNVGLAWPTLRKAIRRRSFPSRTNRLRQFLRTV